MKLVELDASGLNCPMPLLKAKQALNRMQSGDHLRVIATDQGSWRDFQSFAEYSGNQLLNRQQQQGRYIYLLEKK